MPIHVGSGHTLGERGGEQAHTLSIAETARHMHTSPNATSVGATTNNPSAARHAGSASIAADLYASATNLEAMASGAMANVGGSQAHLNMQPFLTLSFCIALQGIFPSPT